VLQIVHIEAVSVIRRDAKSSSIFSLAPILTLFLKRGLPLTVSPNGAIANRG